LDKTELINKLTKYKKILSNHFDIYKVFLYGSYAKGNPHDFSDIDVAIIVNKLEGDFFTYAPIPWKICSDIDVRIEPILLERDKDRSGFLEEIMNTGIEIK
jgi:predicted nucleotidyltransferase